MSTYPIVPYLLFGGNCEAAIEFYRQALGAQLVMQMRFHESPDPVPEGVLPPGYENKIMHATLTIGGGTLMVSDGAEAKVEPAGFNLSLTVPTEAEARQKFEALAVGGQVVMPLGKTFWSPYFGMVKDQFGVIWMLTLPMA